MKENELRIGNFYKAGIEFKGSVEAMLILNGQEREFVLTREKLILILQLKLESHVQGIVLNKDWFEKFGFKKTGFSRWENYSLITYGYGFILADGKAILNVDKNAEIFVEVEYVHELQDLFSALKVKGLTVKSPAS